MNSNVRKKAFGAALIAALGVTVGAFTAPLGVPFMASAIHKAKPDFSALLHIATGGSPVQDWLSYIGAALGGADTRTCLLAWCAAATSAVALYAYYQSLRKPKRSVEEGILGDAKLIEKASEVRKRNDFWDGSGKPESAGLVISSTKEGYVYDSSVPHFAVVGKTGSGKSWLMAIQTLHLCMASRWNLIVTGKEELLELTGDTASRLGYNRVIFDLKGYPGASGFNPLDLIAEYAEAGRIDLAQRTARQTAADLVPMGGESNTYFPKAARSALTACLLIVAMADIPREQKNMSSVCNLVNRGTTGTGADPSAPLKDFIRSDAVGPEHPAYAPAADFLSDGGVTTAGKNVLSTLKEALTIFNDAGIARITAESCMPMRRMIRERTVVYMHLLEEGDPYLVLMTVFLNQWWRVAQDEAAHNGGRLPVETAIVGDEFGNLPAVAAMPQIVTLGRSYRLHAYCFTQDLKQWHKYNKPGDENAGRDKILGSMGGKVALSLANPEDFQYFTRLAGKHTVRTQNTGTSSQGRGIGATDSTSEGYSEHADDLIHEWEWQSRIPVRDGIVCVKGGENSKPGREGVFVLPVTYASETPAAAFFGLGGESECDRKRMDFRERIEWETPDRSGKAPIAWQPDFEACKSESTSKAEMLDDEWSAWDGM